jgi:hypothetical protein
MTRRSLLLIPLALLASTVTAAATAPPPVPGASQPATWRPYDLIVDLHDLPVRYSCDDLWYKFHDVLLALGARPDLQILAYRCAPGMPNQGARSPRVQLRFNLPETVDKSQARWADAHATTETVRLGPGHPASLRDSDCELLRQMKDELLAALTTSTRIVSFDLACAAPHAAHWPFNVTVQSLEAVKQPLAAQARPLPRRVGNARAGTHDMEMNVLP